MLLESCTLTIVSSVIVHAGTNSINSNQSTRSCSIKIHNLCNDKKSVNKHGTIFFFSSVLLRSENLHNKKRNPVRVGELNHNIKNFNEELSNYCFVHQHTFIDHTSYFTVDHLTKDGWHPHFNGKGLLADKIQECLKQHSYDSSYHYSGEMYPPLLVGPSVKLEFGAKTACLHTRHIPQKQSVAESNQKDKLMKSIKRSFKRVKRVYKKPLLKNYSHSYNRKQTYSNYNIKPVKNPVPLNKFELLSNNNEICNDVEERETNEPVKRTR